MHSPPTSWRRTPCTSTTRRCRCWRRARARPRPAGYGPTFATSGHSPVRAHPLRCSSTRRTEKGQHPRAHLKAFRGTIHADGYAGFNELFAGNRIVEAACWAHVRRKFFDVHAANGSPIAKGGARTHRQALRDREGDQRARARSPPTRTPEDDQNRSQRRWPPGPTRSDASCRANPSSPPRSATCGRAGPR